MSKASDRIGAKLPTPRKKAARKGPRVQGLLHGPRYVTIEAVGPRHRKPCFRCAREPKERRLFVRLGSGRHAKVEVYCIACGVPWLERATTEYLRAQQFLLSGEVEGGGAVRV